MLFQVTWAHKNMTSFQHVSLHISVGQFLGNIRIYVPAELEVSIRFFLFFIISPAPTTPPPPVIWDGIYNIP